MTLPFAPDEFFDVFAAYNERLWPFALALWLLTAFTFTAIGQTADDYRGGWKTEVNGVPRTYEFSIRGEVVRGIYCTWCADATTLAFVDGKFGAGGLTFTVTHVDNNGKTTHTDKGTAKFEKPNLVVTGTMTDICVLATVTAALHREYRVTVVEDGVATLWPEIQRAALDIIARAYGRVVTAKEVVDQISGW